MDPSKLSTENVVGTILAGIAIAIIAVWKYLAEKKSPTAANGDRMIPGITIADMEPVRVLHKQQERTAVATERVAAAAEGLLTLLTDQARDDAIEDEVERRVSKRLDDRRRRTTRT